MNLPPQDGKVAPEPSDGVSLGLLIVVAFLLSGNLWALLHWSSTSASTPDTNASGQAGRHEPFSALLVQDLVIGILLLEAEGPPTLHLRPEQKQHLQAVDAKLRMASPATLNRPGELDEQIRRTLTDEQKDYLMTLFREGKTSRQADMGVYLVKFHNLLQR